MTFYNSCLA